MDELYFSLENGAGFKVVNSNGEFFEICLSEGTGAAEWSASMSIDRHDARKLRDWLTKRLDGSAPTERGG